MQRGGCRNSPQQACPALTSVDLRFCQEASGQLEAIITTFPCVEHSGAPPSSDVWNCCEAGSYPSSSWKQTEAPSPSPLALGQHLGKISPLELRLPPSSQTAFHVLHHPRPPSSSISSSGSSAGPGAASAVTGKQVIQEPWGSSGVNHAHTSSPDFPQSLSGMH